MGPRRARLGRRACGRSRSRQSNFKITLLYFLHFTIIFRMGVSRKLLTEVMYRQKAIAGSGDDQSTRRCLTQDELFKYNVANASD